MISEYIAAKKVLPVSVKNRLVPTRQSHRLELGGGLVTYDETYKFGNTVVNIVAPPPMTKEEIEGVLDDYRAACWSIIDELREKGVELDI